jgi:hypothetical protein
MKNPMKMRLLLKLKKSLFLGVCPTCKSRKKDKLRAKLKGNKLSSKCNKSIRKFKKVRRPKNKELRRIIMIRKIQNSNKINKHRKMNKRPLKKN